MLSESFKSCEITPFLFSGLWGTFSVDANKPPMLHVVATIRRLPLLNKSNLEDHPVSKPFRPFVKGTTPVRGLTNHSY